MLKECIMYYVYGMPINVPREMPIGLTVLIEGIYKIMLLKEVSKFEDTHVQEYSI